jgi:hypothetical protein
MQVDAQHRTRERGCLSWPTIRASEYKDVGPVGSKSHQHMLGKHYLCAVVTQEELNGQAAPASSSSHGSRQELWATPRSGKTTDENPETWAKRKAQGDVATMPLTAQVKCWATPIQGDSHLASTPEVAQKRIEEGKVTLSRQMAAQWATPQAHDAQGPKTPEQIEAMRAKGHGVKNLNEQAAWGTPTARDHKSGRGNNERDYKELTPMVERQQSGKLNPRWVETLMGLPVGWVMPSCASPVTIAPTNSDSSATESSRPRQSELF